VTGFGALVQLVASSGDANKPAEPLWTWLILAACLAFFFEDTLLRK
jgi:hypothetical protein